MTSGPDSPLSDSDGSDFCPNDYCNDIMSAEQSCNTKLVNRTRASTAPSEHVQDYPTAIGGGVSDNRTKATIFVHVIIAM